MQFWQPISAIITLGLACSTAPSEAPQTRIPIEEPADLPSPTVEPTPVPAQAPPHDTLFFAATPIGWVGLGCLTAEGVATQAKDCSLEPSVEVEIGLPSGETLSLEPVQTLLCEQTEETIQGRLPVPSGGVAPLSWHPATSTNHWLPASSSPLRSELLPMVSAAGENGFIERGYQHLQADQLKFEQVYSGDLEHSGRQDLLVEVSGPDGDEDPAPSVLVLVTDTAQWLAPEGLDHNGSIELAGSWSAGSGATVLLLKTYWAGGTGTHLVGLNAGTPTLLGQWVCGT